MRRVNAFGAGALLVAGLAHLIAIPDHYQVAPYIGVLFGMFVIASAVLAVGVAREVRSSWPLGALLTATALLLYVVARTVGLPVFHETDWLDPTGPIPIGAIAFGSEALFLALATASALKTGEANRWLRPLA